MKVIKRNGEEVQFDKNKIFVAICKANLDIPEDKQLEQSYIKRITTRVKNIIMEKGTDISVEEISDIVENTLMKAGKYEIARAYIRWRHKQEIARNKYKGIMDSVKKKIRAENIVNQNANVDEHSFGGRKGEASDILFKEIAIEDRLSDMAKNNHLNNEIYIHDLSDYEVGSHNCLSIPFDKLLANGFTTRQTDVRSPKSVSTAMQLVAVIFQLQSLQQFGGVSATHIDWTMIPYVRFSFYKHFKDGMRYVENSESDVFNLDDATIRNTPIGSDIYKKHPKAYNYAEELTEREIYQAVEGLYHNLNTLQSRSGNQLPFTSINYGTCTLTEGRMVTKALLDVLKEGLGKKKRTSIFPCGIFQWSKEHNAYPNTPNYDLYRLALSCTAQRLYPNYANIDWSGNAGYDKNDPRTYFSTMGCRTANGWDINGFGQLKDGRGNICPVTIIMPTLAMEAKECIMKNSEAFSEDLEGQTVDKFLEILDTKIHEAKDMLLERFEHICSQSPDSAKFMYENGVMEGYIPEEGIRSALKHGTLAVGQIGLAETLQILIGCNHTAPKGMELAKHIEQLFKNRCAEFKEQYKLNFGVYYTPAENLCYTSMKKFQDKYGVIENVSDKDFFTNSIHIPVWENVDVFTKIDLESQLTGYSSAGCITYVELDSGVKNNIDALERIVNYAMEKDIPYFAINIPNDMCDECGYIDEINDKCPVCGCTNIHRLRRVTGYLTGDYKTAFNKGKQQEVEMRIKHKKFNSID